MIPVKFVRASMIKSLKPLAYFERKHDTQKSMLVCGSAERPVILNLDGEARAFSAFHPNAIQRDIEGIAIESLDLEVDFATAISDRHADAPAGSLAISASGIEVVALEYSNAGFVDKIEVIISETGDQTENRAKSYFTHWALVCRDEAGHVVWRYDVHAATA